MSNSSTNFQNIYLEYRAACERIGMPFLAAEAWAEFCAKVGQRGGAKGATDRDDIDPQ